MRRPYLGFGTARSYFERDLSRHRKGKSYVIVRHTARERSSLTLSATTEQCGEARGMVFPA